MNTHHSTTVVVPLHRDSSQGLMPLFEALLFDAGKPLTAEQLARAAGTTPQAAENIVRQLAVSLDEDPRRGLCVARIGSAAQLMPKPAYRQVLDVSRRTDVDRQLAVLKEYLHTLSTRGRRPSTLKAFGSFLERFIKVTGKPVEEVSSRDVRFFLMQEEQNGNRRSTLATKVSILKSFFNWLETEELIDKNPMKKVEKPKTPPAAPKYLTHEEIELIREACKKLLDRCLVEVLYGSGLRVSEAVTLDWQDINWQEKTIAVRDGKGGKDRLVPMSTKAALLLKRLKDSRKDNNPWVFQSQYKQRMSKATIEYRVRNIGKRAKLSGVLTPHRFRHSLATHLLEAGCPIDVVQAILGHSDISTTQIYAKTQRSVVESWYRKVVA